MRLFHVSEEPDITVFHPRLPSRKDLDPDVGLVWAIDEAYLTNFLTPRDCPRVAYHVNETTTDEDIRRFFTSSENTHAVVIESGWYERLKNTTLYLYEFDLHEFELQDSAAGYYVAKTTQIPIAKHVVTDLISELVRRSTEFRITDNLRQIAEDVQKSTLDWSLCRMKNAK